MCPHGIVIHRWLYYQDWLQSVYDFALKVNAKLLLYKTTNFICDAKRFGSWKTLSSLYLAKDKIAIENCSEILEPRAASYNITREQVVTYCRDAQFTSAGEMYLNSQVINFVENIQKSSYDYHSFNESDRLLVGIFNDKDVQTCNTTHDAIHHHFNLALRIRLLGNTIEGLLTCRDL